MVVTLSECPFCRITRGEDLEVREVYRNEHVVAFFPTEPAVLGHTLLVPRDHVPDIWALPEAVASQLLSATLHLAAVLRVALSPEGLNIIQSNGEAATQTVPHLHVHLVPRWADDQIGPIWPKETHFSDADKDDVAERIRILASQP